MNWSFITFILVYTFFFSCKSSTSEKEASNKIKIVAPLAKEKLEVKTINVDFLVNSCAIDFAKQNSAAFEFRDSHIGIMVDTKRDTLHILCGQFRAKNSGIWSDWSSFATVKTSGYEQWQGTQSENLCNDKRTVWNKDKDLSHSIQIIVDSLKSKKY